MRSLVERVHRSRMWVLAAVAAVAVLSAACGSVTGRQTPAEQGSTYPLNITDDLGRQVTVQKQPERIVSLAPSNTEILFAVGAGPRVVGVTKFDDYPEQVKALPNVGGFSAKTISVESIVNLKPDLVVSAGEIQRPVIDALTQLQIPVIALNPKNFEGIYQNIELIGRVTGDVVAARKTVQGMRRRAQAVGDVVSRIAPDQRVTVFWEVWNEPLMTAGPGTFIGQMIELAGGVNIFADVRDQDYPRVSSEDVVARDPMVILAPSRDSGELTMDALRVRPAWSGIRAVREGRLVIIDADLVSRPGPRIMDGLEQVAKALYPELFR